MDDSASHTHSIPNWFIINAYCAGLRCGHPQGLALGVIPRSKVVCPFHGGPVVVLRHPPPCPGLILGGVAPRHGGGGSGRGDRPVPPPSYLVVVAGNPFFIEPRLRDAVAGFDKGQRVPRLAEGAVLDARQVGILVSGAGRERTVRLVEYDPTITPGMVGRLEAMVEEKGTGAKQVLLFALSTGLLKTFEVEERHGKATITGSRGAGYTVIEAIDKTT